MPQSQHMSNIHEGRMLAEKLRTVPEVSRRLIHTERIWQFRHYQGTDPANIIDWKQSARTEIPVVREHEQLKSKETFFWAHFQTIGKEHQQNVQLVLSTLAYLLTYKERVIGWLGDIRLKTHYTFDLLELLKNSMMKEQSLLPLSPIQNSMIIIANDFSTPSEEFTQIMRCYYAQGNKLLLIHVGDKQPHFSLKAPHINLTTETKTEPFVIDLLDKILSDTK